MVVYNNAPLSMSQDGTIGFKSQDGKTWEKIKLADFPNAATGLWAIGGIGQD